MKRGIILHITVLCVGKIKEKYILDGIAEFQKRLQAFTKLEILELQEYGKEQNVDLGIQKESRELLEALNKLGGYHILLDLKGRERSSEEMAKHLEQLQVQGKSRINFVIGGSDGYNEEVRNFCHEALSFSKFTFPHQLMRLFLVEQIYRWFSINHRIKYHK